MKHYLVRTYCEYVIAVEAENEEDAKDKADAISYKKWQSAWADYEAEEYGAEITDLP